MNDQQFACCGWKYDADFSQADRTVTTENGVNSFNMFKPSSCCKQNLNLTGNGNPLPVWNNTIVFESFEKCRKGESGFYNVEVKNLKTKTHAFI